MVLSQKKSYFEAHSLVYDGKREVQKFSSFLKFVIMAAKLEEYTEFYLLEYLDRPAFECYHETFAADGELIDNNKK